MASRSPEGDSDQVNPQAPATNRTSEHRWPVVVRIVVVLALGLVILLPLLWLTALLGFAGGRFGWIPTAASFAALCGATGWVAVPGRWPAARRDTTTGLALVAALLGIVTAHVAPPTAGRLRHEIAQVAQPGWRLSNDEVSGNAACFDYCTSVTREYRVDAPPAEVVSSLRPLLLDAGYEPAPHPFEGRVELRHDGGEIDLAVDIAPGPRDTSRVFITAST
jgi:hypothetical protein